VCREWANLDRWEKEEWDDQVPPRIQIGDMCRPQGGTYWRIAPDEEQLTETDDGWATVTGDPVEANRSGTYSRERNGTWYKIDHQGHAYGHVADVRPMVSKDNDVGEVINLGTALYADPVNEKKYSLPHSQKFLNILENASPKSQGEHMLQTVLFGDEDIDVSTREYYNQRDDHGNHYHIRVA
jgi:hypothetical protein